ncbi:MAG TPA: hypothetical protein VIM33_07595 [Gaiellaceae bacterium]|jgi:5-bromo-4-chloroindolyl phosphate hydrolysis protein
MDSATQERTGLDEVVLTRPEYEHLRDRLAHAEQYAWEALETVQEINSMLTWNLSWEDEAA